MEATVRFTEPTAGTVFPQMLTAHVLTAQPISGDPLDGARIPIFVDDRGFKHLNELLRGDRNRMTVTDLLTGTEHVLVRADCGLGCRCAIRISDSRAAV